MSKKKIIEFAKEIDIPYLVHFTHISNLGGILENGLWCRNFVEASDEEIIINDKERYDKRTYTISLSIAHPNDLMFYKYRKKDEDWCVIVLKRKVLWENHCLFFKHNAADSRVSNLHDDDLSKFEAFQGMYDEIDEFDSREEQCLKDFDPTDKQAEVLVVDHIPAENILGVFLSNRHVKKAYKDILVDTKVVINGPDKGVYATRLYRRKWQ